MFRLQREDSPHGVRIAIGGALADEAVALAESACLEALAADVPVTVVLDDVTEIDVRGRALLRRLAATHARLHAGGVYLRYVIDHARASA